MVKLAYSPLSQLASTDIMSNVCPNNMIKPTLSEVLQSDSVKRLFNQPDLIIKTIPLSPLESRNAFLHKRNGMNSTSNHTTASEISIFPVGTSDEEKEDANLLPSKIKHKKSEIALLPIKKKSCGHYQPCENIICDVTVQQYVDKDCVSPMLALSIEENEINAPVEKHCRNKYCDALSIDHNRCRQASIKLYKCDSSYTCDICGRTFKKLISWIHHRNCKRKKVYIHNDVDRLHLLKERMRIRELQILEIAKMKKRDYSDPNKVMETLWKNEELIIIPQKAPSQPRVSMTLVPNTQLTNTNAQPIINHSQITKSANTFGSASVTVSSQNTVVFPNNTLRSESNVKSIGQVTFPNLQQNSYLESTSVMIPAKAQTQVPVSSSTPVLTLALVPTSTSSTVPTSTSVPTLAITLAPNSASTSASTLVPLTLTLASSLAPAPVSVPAITQISAPNVITTSASTSIVPPNKSCIQLTVSPQTTTVQPINNLSVSPSHIVKSTAIQPKTFLTPIRVVPIANLISPPSLLHRTQGIPKFCIVAEKTTPVTTSNSPSVQPTVATVVSTATVNAPKSLTHVPIPKIHKSKLKKKKQSFFCDYCSKYITTDWYFKVHIAKHKGQKLFFCNFCDESFSNNYDMKKHITNQHTDQKELACDKCNYTCTSLASFKSHIHTHAISSILTKVDSKKQKKSELLKKLENKVNHKLIHNTYERKVKRIKCEDTSDSQNKQQHNKQKHNNKNLSAINKDNNAKTKGCNSFVSVKKIEPENFKSESPITSR
ncbi:PREDICTED: A-agglutinin anchorage subunit-like [Trachymyrmex cornetzi]|uniref:Putative zinc finger and SCAN domain-containing protein 5D n=1 Tax=Trachymyrmex cornetzi TaxID=471704 RepID=A0A195E3S5_9HYME|nr:PREDICTED: A-agglutinin anchorage subunit-like [Trachymyrmex cornetzi]KYN19798.1 Putative zinc finger and SCAN domain-containing protein 5D [Trachymyrmex cornetzi]